MAALFIDFDVHTIPYCAVICGYGLTMLMMTTDAECLTIVRWNVASFRAPNSRLTPPNKYPKGFKPCRVINTAGNLFCK